MWIIHYHLPYFAAYAVLLETEAMFPWTRKTISSLVTAFGFVEAILRELIEMNKKDSTEIFQLTIQFFS